MLAGTLVEEGREIVRALSLDIIGNRDQAQRASRLKVETG
jgi:hypothetical protein